MKWKYPKKSTKTSFRSVISDVAAAISMTKLPSDAVDEEDEELQVIVEHEGMVLQNKLSLTPRL